MNTSKSEKSSREQSPVFSPRGETKTNKHPIDSEDD
jgi:hypothetical protein